MFYYVVLRRALGFYASPCSEVPCFCMLEVYVYTMILNRKRSVFMFYVLYYNILIALLHNCQKPACMPDGHQLGLCFTCKFVWKDTCSSQCSKHTIWSTDFLLNSAVYFIHKHLSTPGIIYWRLRNCPYTLQTLTGWTAIIITDQPVRPLQVDGQVLNLSLYVW